MIQIFVLILAVFGASDGSDTFGTSDTAVKAWKIKENSKEGLPVLPGSANLNEKVIPLSKLAAPEYLLEGGAISVEKADVFNELPGTKNLQEKRIPESILRTLYQPYEDHY